MKTFARIAGILLVVFGLFLMTVFAFGVASGGLASGLPIAFLGLLVVSCALDKPGPIQEADCSISGKRLSAFVLIGIFAAVLFKFGFDKLTLWPAVLLLGILFVVVLIFGLATMVDIKTILQLVKSGKTVDVAREIESPQ